MFNFCCCCEVTGFLAGLYFIKIKSIVTDHLIYENLSHDILLDNTSFCPRITQESFHFNLNTYTLGVSVIYQTYVFIGTFIKLFPQKTRGH